MIAYIDRYLGKDNIKTISDHFPEITFTTEEAVAKEAEIIICMQKFFIEHDLDEFPRLRWVQYLMAGYDRFNIAKANAKKILFTTAQDVFSFSIAEDVLAKILLFNRNLRHYHELQKQRKWEPIPKEPELYQATVGILGAGSIARELAIRLKAFDARILCYRKRQEAAAFAEETFWTKSGLIELLERSDYIIVAMPLADATRQLLDREMLQKIRAHALLINIARGEIIDQDALIDCLKAKTLRGAGLDVTTPEPLPPDNELWMLDNVFITPHNASSSPRMRERLLQLVENNLRRYLNNEELRYLVRE